MTKRYLPKEMPPELTGHLLTMFEQHFGVTLEKVKDPQTGQEYVNLAQVCEILGLDPAEQQAQLLADPVLGDGVVIVEPDASRPPPMEPADLQAHRSGICNSATCRFCH